MRSRALFSIALTLLLVPRVAHAAPTSSSTLTVDEPKVTSGLLTPSAELAAAASRSPGRALGLALGSTLALVAAGSAIMLTTAATTDDVAPYVGGMTVGGTLVGLGLTVAPGLGHLYAAESKHFWYGVAARVGIAGAGVAAFFIPLLCGAVEMAFTLAGLHALSFLALAVYDIVDAPRAVDRYNRHLAQHSIAFAPLVSRSEDGAKRYGLMALVRF